MSKTDEPCPNCGGNCWCGACHGECFKPNGKPCTTCNGSGNCPRCNGSGKK